MSCLVFTICSTIEDQFGRRNSVSAISKNLAEPFFFNARGKNLRGLAIFNFMDKSIIFDFEFHLRCYWARQLPMTTAGGENAPLERNYSVRYRRCRNKVSRIKVTENVITRSAATFRDSP